MKRIAAAALIGLVFCGKAQAEPTLQIQKATGLPVVSGPVGPHKLTVRRAVAVLPACSLEDGIDWRLTDLRRASPTVIHLEVEGEGEWAGDPGTWYTVLTVRIDRGKLRAFRPGVGFYRL